MGGGRALLSKKVGDKTNYFLNNVYFRNVCVLREHVMQKMVYFIFFIFFMLCASNTPLAQIKHIYQSNTHTCSL